ncbi:hypothetical protein ES695_15620 [Candidatus Atribacteria bacterium 1244-E10-H5-B2]|nr:MAG: hypothetical protein ES695_15620 [Candidatus Atribacteria bacterium 1244-E10-H5-B2]
MKLLRSIALGALVTIFLSGFGFGAVRFVIFLGEINPIYPFMLILIGVWAFCTAIFYSNK